MRCYYSHIWHVFNLSTFIRNTYRVSTAGLYTNMLMIHCENLDSLEFSQDSLLQQLLRRISENYIRTKTVFNLKTIFLQVNKPCLMIKDTSLSPAWSTPSTSLSLRSMISLASARPICPVWSLSSPSPPPVPPLPPPFHLHQEGRAWSNKCKSV